MNNFEEYLAIIDNSDHSEQLRTVLQWVSDNYPKLDTRVAWKQPMFTDHGTFIVGFSVAKNHFSVATEKAIEVYRTDIEENYDAGKKLFKIPFDAPVNYDLLKKLIDWNIEQKKDIQTFWWK